MDARGWEGTEALERHGLLLRMIFAVETRNRRCADRLWSRPPVDSSAMIAKIRSYGRPRNYRAPSSPGQPRAFY
jgi:hypothetical protein